MILAGEFDPLSPVDHGYQIARTLSQAYVYEIPGRSHGGRTACENDLINQFVRDPSQAPDASCLKQLPKIVFVTKWS